MKSAMPDGGTPGGRLLAAMLGLYLALSLGRTGAALRQEMHRAESIQGALTQTRAQLDALERDQEMTEEDLRLLALQRWRLIAPGDVLFFDGGAWDGETLPKIKGG